jgi:hypothetical protein
MCSSKLTCPMKSIHILEHVLPHVWLNKAVPTKFASTIDFAEHGVFTLLIGTVGEHWHEAAKRVSTTLGVPINLHSIEFRQQWEDSYCDCGANARPRGDRSCVGSTGSLCGAESTSRVGKSRGVQDKAPCSQFNSRSEESLSVGSD